MSARPTRRAFLAAGAAAVLAGCGASGGARPGSTLERRLVDPDGDGLLAVTGGLALRDRTELAPAAATERVLATFAQVSDVHVRDAQSPGRVAFLDRLGPRLGAAFRPHEALTTQVLAATVRAVNAAGPELVLVTGDLVDSAQRNELAWALRLLRGGTIRPDSGGRGYAGVQEATIADPLYYRPDVDAPRHPGLLARAVAPVHSPGLAAPWHALPGNHDLLVAGELPPSAATQAAATGDRLLVTPSDDLLRGLQEGTIDRARIDALLAAGLPGETLRVAPDPRRAALGAPAVLERLGGGDRVVDTAAIRYILLDLVRHDGGSGGVVLPATLTFLQQALAGAGARHVVVAGHQPLADAAGAAPALAVLDADPRVIAVLAGHTHRNAVEPRRTAAGGYWLITSASVVDWPQQWRMLRLVATRGGGVALETWTADHDGRPGDEDDLAGIARDLAFLDPQGGRPAHAAGAPSVRNVRLHLGRRSLRPAARPPVVQAEPVAPQQGFGAGDAVA